MNTTGLLFSPGSVSALFTALVLSCSTVMAEEKEEVVDPSDLTRVYTMGSVWVNTQNNLRATAQWAGSWTETQSFMGFIEGYWGDKEDEDKWGTDFLNLRAQYFHVLQTGFKELPSTGLSFDYIDEKKGSTLYAVGALAMLSPERTGSWQVFPNIALMEGEVADEDVDGYMINLYGTYPVNDKGTFIQIWPEFISVKGDGVESDSLTLSALFSMPLDNNRKTWLNIRLDHARKETKLPVYQDRINEDETVLTTGLKFYL